MAQVRLCDRCGARATALDLASTTKTLVVPVGEPSTNAVAADVNVTLGVQAAEDLCAPCFASALLEYAFARMAGAPLPAAAIAALVHRIEAVMGPLA